LAEQLEERRVEEWQRDWAEKEKERTVAHQKLLDGVLRHPDNDREKRLRSELLAEIKRRAKEVLNLADEQNAELEMPQAMEIAREDVIGRRVEEERARVKQEMTAAAAVYEKEQLEKEEERKRKFESNRRDHEQVAARKIQRMYRIWRASTEVRRLAEGVYIKRFDPASHACFYLNRQLGTVRWTRPAALGPYDIDPEDAWVVMDGAFDLKYYHNPRSGDIAWRPPGATLPCQDSAVGGGGGGGGG
ncbi:unnamed protein product, partial [Phaeothamnion confervicola]